MGAAELIVYRANAEKGIEKCTTEKAIKV